MKATTVCVLAVLLLAAAAQAQKEAPSAAVVVQVAKAVNGTDGKADAKTAAPTPAPVEASAAEKKSVGPSQQPAIASPPKKGSPQQVTRAAPAPAAAGPRWAAPNAAWQQTATSSGFNPLSNVRLLSPLCPGDTEATACASFSGNTAVVVSSVMPAIGTNTNVKTTQCFCDFRNTVNAFLPANGNEVYRCAAYCQ